MNGDESRAGFARRLLAPHAAALSGVLATSAVATGLALAPPYLVKLVIDRALLAGELRLLFALCAAMVGIAVVGAAVQALNQWLHTRVSGEMLFAIREGVYAHLLRLSPRTLAARREGDLLTRLDGDVAEVQRFALDALLALATGTIGLIATLALLLHLAPRLTALAALLLPAEWLFLRWVRPRIEVRTRQVRERASDVTSFLVETLPAAKQIQAAAAESRQRDALHQLHASYLRDLLRLQLTNLGGTAIPQVMSSAAQAGVFALGGYAVVAGQLSLGSLLAFSAYLTRAVGPVQTLLGVYVASRRARVSWDRLGEIMRIEPEVRSPAHPRPFPAGPGEVVLNEVQFGHLGAEPVLAQASLRVPGGSRIELRGISGVGKSTLVDLLARHYDPDAGHLYLDGVDLRELDLAELRRQVAVVGQGGVIFAGTLADNIRYAAPEADDAAVEKAALAAGLGPFLASRSERLATPLGPRGTTLSGGEAQRVLLARALLVKPRVLVLDEATSEIDAATERSILDQVEALFGSTTRIVIRHRSEGSLRGGRAVTLRDGSLFEVAP